MSDKKLDTENQAEESQKVEATKEQETVQENSNAESQSENETQEQNVEKEVSVEEKLAALEKENAELKDQLLRRAADFDNYRKRMLKERQETFDYANAALLGDLLESLDNFDRTIDAAKDTSDAKSIADGIKIINTSLVKMLEDKYGLKSYGVSGEDFNPDEHEAIGRFEDETATSEILKDVYLKGYKLKEKVIRLAKVTVTVPKA